MEKMVFLIAAVLVVRTFLHPGDHDVHITCKDKTILPTQVLVVARMREELGDSQETAGKRTATGAPVWLLVFLAAPGGFVTTFTMFVSLKLWY